MSPLFNFLLLLVFRLFPSLYCWILLISSLRLPRFLHSLTRCLPSMGSPHPPATVRLSSSVSFFLLCGILPQKPVSQPAGDLTRPFCRSAIRIGSCQKTTSEGTSGSCCLASLIPNQPFIYNTTLVSAPPRRSAQIWEQQRVATCDGGQISRPSGGISKVLKRDVFIS